MCLLFYSVEFGIFPSVLSLHINEGHLECVFICSVSTPLSACDWTENIPFLTGERGSEAPPWEFVKTFQQSQRIGNSFSPRLSHLWVLLGCMNLSAAPSAEQEHTTEGNSADKWWLIVSQWSRWCFFSSVRDGHSPEPSTTTRGWWIISTTDCWLSR